MYFYWPGTIITVFVYQNVRMHSIPPGISRKLMSFYMGIFTKYAEFAMLCYFKENLTNLFAYILKFNID